MSGGWTPGPWAIRRGHAVVEIRTEKGLQIASTTSDAYWENFKPETLANAYLMRAAPELYESLDALNAHWNGEGDYETSSDDEARLQNMVNAALAKARGESA